MHRAPAGQGARCLAAAVIFALLLLLALPSRAHAVDPGPLAGEDAVSVQSTGSVVVRQSSDFPDPASGEGGGEGAEEGEGPISLDASGLDGANDPDGFEDSSDPASPEDPDPEDPEDLEDPEGSNATDPTPDSPSLYALLYDTGELAFQTTPEPDEAKGALVVAYDDFANSSFTDDSPAPWHERRGQITELTFASSVQPTSMAYWFAGLTNLQFASICDFDGAEVTDLSGLFKGCTRLSTVEMYNLGLMSRAFSFAEMFKGCTNLTSADFGVDAWMSRDYREMFADCTSLKNLWMNQQDASIATDLSGMFRNCASLEELDLSELDPKLAIESGGVSGMFTGCAQLRRITLGRCFQAVVEMDFPTAPSTGIYTGEWAGYLCEDPWEVDPTYEPTGSVVANGDFPTVYTGRTASGEPITGHDYNPVTWMWRTLEAAGAPAYAVLYADGSLVFQRTAELDPTKGGKGALVFTDFESVRFQTNWNESPWHEHAAQIRTVVFAPGADISPVSLAGWFSNCENLASVDFTGLDTSRVVDMQSLFENCAALVEVDLTGFNTSNVFNMGSMFAGCSSLERIIGLGGLSTRRVLSFNNMFGYTNEHVANRVKVLDLSSFDTSHAMDGSYLDEDDGERFVIDQTGSWSYGVDMSLMFSGCRYLEELLTGPRFVTENVRDLAYLFAGTVSLKSLDVGAYDTRNVFSMQNMFELCGAPVIDGLESFITSKVAVMQRMFMYSYASELFLGGFDTSSVLFMKEMFLGCDRLEALDVSRFDPDLLETAAIPFDNEIGFWLLELPEGFATLEDLGITLKPRPVVEVVEGVASAGLVDEPPAATSAVPVPVRVPVALVASAVAALASVPVSAVMSSPVEPVATSAPVEPVSIVALIEDSAPASVALPAMVAAAIAEPVVELVAESVADPVVPIPVPAAPEPAAEQPAAPAPIIPLVLIPIVLLVLLAHTLRPGHNV